MNDLGQVLMYHSATREDNYAIFTATRNVEICFKSESGRVRSLRTNVGNFDANDNRG